MPKNYPRDAFLSGLFSGAGDALTQAMTLLMNLKIAQENQAIDRERIGSEERRHKQVLTAEEKRAQDRAMHETRLEAQRAFSSGLSEQGILAYPETVSGLALPKAEEVSVTPGAGAMPFAPNVPTVDITPAMEALGSRRQQFYGDASEAINKIDPIRGGAQPFSGGMASRPTRQSEQTILNPTSSRGLTDDQRFLGDITQWYARLQEDRQNYIRSRQLELGQFGHATPEMIAQWHADYNQTYPDKAELEERIVLLGLRQGTLPLRPETTPPPTTGTGIPSFTDYINSRRRRP